MLVTPAHAFVLRDDPGGNIGIYAARFGALARTGEPVAIAGECASACTLVLGLVPSAHVCLMPGARFAFHSAYYLLPGGREITSRAGTHFLWRAYPPRVRAWLAARGGLTARPLVMRGAESGLQNCY